MKVIRYSDGVQVGKAVDFDRITDFLYTQPFGMYEIHNENGAVAVGWVTKHVELFLTEPIQQTE